MTPYLRKSGTVHCRLPLILFSENTYVLTNSFRIYQALFSTILAAVKPQVLLKALTQTNLDMNKQLEQTSHFVHSGPISDILCNCGFVSFPIKKQLLFWQWSAFCFSLIYTSISLHIIYAIA